MEIMLASLSKSTIKQYESSLLKWSVICTSNNVDRLGPDEKQVIAFLTKEFERGAAYGTLNSHRSAISLVTSNKMGKSVLIKRFLKGCFKSRPTNPKYSTTWDVNVVLDYLENLGNTLELSTENLTYKTLTLLALCTAQRSQTLSKIKIENIIEDSARIEIRITDIIKTSRPGFNQPSLIIPKFNVRPGVCVYACIKHYIERTKEARNEQPYLFLSLKKPFISVGAQTLSRWIKVVLPRAGIYTRIFSGHSTRHASTSAAYSKGLNLETIKKTAGWSEKSEVFAKHYNRPVVKQNSADFALSILNK